MMKSVGFVLLLLVLVSCSSPETGKQEQADSGEKMKSEVQRNLVAEYQTFVTGLDSTVAESSGKAAEKFRELFRGSPKETCDSAFLIFAHLYENLESHVSSAVEQDSILQQVYWDHVEVTNEISLDLPALRKFEKKLLKNGYRLELWEGNLMAGTDRSFLEKQFYSLVSPAMRSFLQLLHSDDDNPFQHDAGIVISEQEYVKRLIQWEAFIENNPAFIWMNHAREMYRMYLTYFLVGMDNTPSYYHETGNDGKEVITDLDPYFARAYTYLKKKHAESLTYAKVKPYWKAILQKDPDQIQRLEKQYQKDGFMIDFSKGYQLYF